ncbi:hypothetical protein FOXYSP1_14478 [Fusarium oxysporum f. sp. phaseoli]
MPDEQKGCGDLQQAGAYATYMYHARESQILLADQCSELIRLLPGWDLLDFSGLEKIEFSPEIPDGEHHSGYEDLPCLERKEIEQRSAKILNAMAYKSLSMLKTLILNGRGIMDWPAERATLEFPALEQFVHAFGWVNPIVLRIPYIEWRHLFDAIRDHQTVTGQSTSGLEVNLRYIHTSQGVRMSYRGVISHDSNIASERKMLSSDPEGLMDSQYCLEKHFYNELPFKYNYGLRFMLEKPTVTSDPRECILSDFYPYWSGLEPTGKLSTALLSYGDVLQKDCKWDSVDVVGIPTCTYPALADWCAFSDAVPTSLLPAWSSLGSSASSWWAENKDDIISGAQQCPKRWFIQMVDVVYAQVRLNNTITYGACYDLAKRHVEASLTDGPEASETSASTATSGQGATSESQPAATEMSISSNTENTSCVARVESWTLVMAILVATWLPI